MPRGWPRTSARSAPASGALGTGPRPPADDALRTIARRPQLETSAAPRRGRRVAGRVAVAALGGIARASRRRCDSMPSTSRASVDGSRRHDDPPHAAPGEAPRPSAGCPGTGRTSPPSDSSPMSATAPGAARTCSEPRQDPERDREIERGAGLAQLGRGEVDRDPPRRVAEAGVADRAADPLAGLLERRVSKADDREPGQPGATSTSTRMTRPSMPDERGGQERWRARGEPYRPALDPAHPDLCAVTRRRAAAERRGRVLQRGARRCAGAATGGGVWTTRAKSSSDRPSSRVGLREHERRAAVQGADRAAVLVDDLVVDRAASARPRRS